MEKMLAEKTVKVNEEGYLLEFAQWDKDVANAIAVEEKVELIDRHWKAIEWIQNEFKNDSPLSIRGIKNSGALNIKEFYELFPGGPLKKASKIAGIPKPKSCI